jgi:hypothetical protein
MQLPSPPRSPLLENDMHPHMPDGTDSLKAKALQVDDSMMPAHPEKAPNGRDSQPEPSPLNGAAEKQGTDQNGDADHISLPPKQPSFIPRAHTLPTQPQSPVSRLASPGSVSTASAPSQPRQSSQLPLARSSILPLSRPLCGSRALRAANFLNSLFPSPGQFIPCGPFADRERVDRDWEVGSVRLAVEGEGQVVVGEGDGS